MGQVLRITVGNKDQSFTLLVMNISTPENAQLEVEWLGEQLKLVRKGRSWIVLGNEQPDMAAIAESIGKALALRYRF